MASQSHKEKREFSGSAPIPEVWSWRFGINLLDPYVKTILHHHEVRCFVEQSLTPVFYLLMYHRILQVTHTQMLTFRHKLSMRAVFAWLKKVSFNSITLISIPLFNDDFPDIFFTYFYFTFVELETRSLFFMLNTFMLVTEFLFWKVAVIPIVALRCGFIVFVLLDLKLELLCTTRYV